MRSDIKPGATFPDYELPDHENVPRKLSELQGDDPLILTLARGHYCPKEHQQHLELAAFYPKIAVAYTQIATISTDDHHDAPGVPRLGRRPVALPLRPRAHGAEGPRHPGVHRPRARPDDPAHARAQARARRPQHLQRLLVLGAPLGRRPLARPAGGDVARSAPIGTSATPGLREAWEAGDLSPFHGWNKRGTGSRTADESKALRCRAERRVRVVVDASRSELAALTPDVDSDPGLAAAAPSCPTARRCTPGHTCARRR